MKKILITLLVFIFTINTTNAWIWLIADSWDVLSVLKWNELVAKLNTKLDQSNVSWVWNIDVVNSWTWVLISFTWSVSSASIPYIDSNITNWIYESSTRNISIKWINFDPNTNVSIPGWPWTINSVNVNWPTSIDINITSSSWTWVYDIVLSNAWVQNTLWTSNWVWLINVLPPSTWKDLRLWGDPFSDWNWAWNDIRYRSWMNMTRDSTWMYFSWSTPWSSWVKFESMSWSRGSNKTLEWIFTAPSSNMMIGIGSNATDETNTAQYQQAEVEMYFQNSTSLWGLYWNNGSLWTAWNQSNSATISWCSSQIFKWKFTNDWTAWSSVFTLYCLPSSSISDWDDISNVLKTFTVWWTLNPDETTIMPFIIPQSAWTQRFIALKVE